MPVEAHAFGAEIPGLRVDVEKGMGPAFDGRSGHQPGVQGHQPGAGAQASVDEMQAGAGGVQGGQETGQQVFVAGRRGLGHHRLAVADA